MTVNNTVKLKITVFLSIIILAACSDYQGGYRDGYNRHEQSGFILFGRSDYQQGYRDGKAEFLHADWMKENPATDDKQCRDILVEADPLLFLPAGYRQTGPGIYSRIQEGSIVK